MKKTILVVEDEMDVALAVEAILEDEGFDVITCGDGLEAQNILKERVPDLILSDIMMPHCNGYQLLEFVSTEKLLKSVPFVLMSAITPKAEGKKADSFLKKPFDLENLLVTVEKVLNKRR